VERRAQPRSDREAGFTIIEVMVAMVILLVGVLGTLTLVEGGLASTQTTTAREQGTNLARDLVERSRQVPYTATTMSLAPAQLRATLADAGALSGSSFTVARRNVTYTVTVTACSIDDPSDGAGYGDASFCAAPTTTTGPGSPPPGPAAAVNVLGIAVSLGGSLLATVCNAVGTNSALLATLTSAVSTVAPLSLCASTASGSVAYDSRPDDLRRMRIDVAWTQGTSSSVSQTALLTNSLPNNCPLTTPVAPATLPAGCPTPIS